MDDHTGKDRQKLLAEMQKQGRQISGAGLPVLFMKETDNPFDRDAVAVVSSVVCLLFP
jgi:hypothetical protein